MAEQTNRLPDSEISWQALVQKYWGEEYQKPEWCYQFSNGRKFEDKQNPYA